MIYLNTLRSLRKLLGICVASGLLILFSSSTSEAQISTEDSNGQFSILSLGVGVSSSELAMSFGVSYSFDHQLISCHVIYMTQSGLNIGESSQPPPSQDIEYAILYGLQTDLGPVRVSASTGVSLVRSIHIVDTSPQNHQYTFNTREDVTSAGLPVDLRLHFAPNSTWGCSLMYFANVNQYYSYQGVSYSVIYSMH